MTEITNLPRYINRTRPDFVDRYPELWDNEQIVDLPPEEWHEARREARSSIEMLAALLVFAAVVYLVAISAAVALLVRAAT